MTRRRGTARLVVRVALVALAGLSGACHEEPPGWSPVWTDSSVRVLQERVEATLEELERARAESATAPEALEGVQGHLEVLLDYHLPLLEARERAANAYRYHLLGRPRERAGELDAVRRLLEGIGTGRPRVARELEQPLETLLHLGTLLAGEGSNEREIRARFERLLDEIHALELKAYLALKGSSLETP